MFNLSTYFTPFANVSIVDFKQVIASTFPQPYELYSSESIPPTEIRSLHSVSNFCVTYVSESLFNKKKPATLLKRDFNTGRTKATYTMQ